MRRRQIAGNGELDKANQVGLTSSCPAGMLTADRSGEIAPPGVCECPLGSRTTKIKVSIASPLSGTSRPTRCWPGRGHRDIRRRIGSRSTGRRPHSTLHGVVFALLVDEQPTAANYLKRRLSRDSWLTDVQPISFMSRTISVRSSSSARSTPAWPAAASA
jgi:hypothetical protein